MPLVKTLVPGEEPAATETAVWLHNNTGGSLTIGILQGEYLKFAPGVTSGYALTTNNQYSRYQRQITIQPTYAQWFSLGYLTPPPPPPDPEPEEEPMSTTPTDDEPTQTPIPGEPTQTPEEPTPPPEAPTQQPVPPPTTDHPAPTPTDDECR